MIPQQRPGLTTGHSVVVALGLTMVVIPSVEKRQVLLVSSETSCVHDTRMNREMISTIRDDRRTITVLKEGEEGEEGEGKEEEEVGGGGGRGGGGGESTRRR